ncbi:MAG: cytochrome c maturation protein CcmE [Saprospiraceae bacterium]
MKKLHIAASITVLIAIALLVMSSKDISSYATFEIAEKSQQRVKIVGHLDHTAEMKYDPENAPNYFSFHMLDANDRSQKVILSEPKPRDFEMSESIVVSGKMQEEGFIADEILLKCPSKYKDEELALKDNS